MESRFKLVGHPLHPMIVPLPLMAFPASLLFDLLHLLTKDEKWRRLAFWHIAAGVIGGLAAAAPGLVDWLAIPPSSPAKKVGLAHMLLNLGIIGLYGAHLVERKRREARFQESPGLRAGIIGNAILNISAWLGGELVYRHSIGVEGPEKPIEMIALRPKVRLWEKSAGTIDSRARMG